MKRGIIVLLAAGAIGAAAEEPQAPAPPPDLVQPEVLTEVPTDQLEALRQQQRGNSLPRVVVPPILVNIPLPGGTCYFIRTLRPVMPEADMQRNGFIPLQARVNAVQRGPNCSPRGQLAPLVPAGTPDDGQPQADLALTPVALAPAPAVAPKPEVAEP